MKFWPWIIKSQTGKSQWKHALSFHVSLTLDQCQVCSLRFDGLNRKPDPQLLPELRDLVQGNWIWTQNLIQLLVQFVLNFLWSGQEAKCPYTHCQNNILNLSFRDSSGNVWGWGLISCSRTLYLMYTHADCFRDSTVKSQHQKENSGLFFSSFSLVKENHGLFLAIKLEQCDILQTENNLLYVTWSWGDWSVNFRAETVSWLIKYLKNWFKLFIVLMVVTYSWQWWRIRPKWKPCSPPWSETSKNCISVGFQTLGNHEDIWVVFWALN